MTVVEVVWFACWDCELDGLYQVNLNDITCPDCGGLMLQIYTDHRKVNYDEF
jgi:Zn finger protein HypA/HybF involved in hydrogenase expression